MGALYALAALGLLAAPRRFLSLALAVLAYQTLLAMAFAGATRYRVPWDFLLAVWAAAGLRAAFRRLAGDPADLAFPLLRGRRPLRPPPF
jgi:hypothetical protein